MSERDQFSLIARVRQGLLNFERLVEVLSTRGYVTDLETEAGLSFNRPAMNCAHPDDFDALFKVLMPDRINDIQILAIGTDRGGIPGAVAYALFNTNIVEYEDMMQRLEKMNRDQAKNYF